MQKFLLKLKSRKGSVLFIVLSIMTVLIILASAVYYSVMSARQNVEINYSDKQAYQSALSVDSIMNSYLQNGATGSQFMQSIIELDPTADKVVYSNGTGTDGFTELTGGMGEYKITIKKLSGGATDETQVIQITTETRVNGETTTISTVGEIQVSSTPYCFDRFFTSTGYAPNDVFMSGMTIDSTVYLDNEYTQIGSDVGGDSAINLNSEIICAGTLQLYNAPLNKTNKTYDITVGNNFYLSFSAGDLNLQGGTLRVGGSLVQKTNCYNFRKTNVYVIGDYVGGSSSDAASPLFVNGDCCINYTGDYNGDMYVNGDLYFGKNYGDWDKHLNGNVEIGGNAYVWSVNQKNYLENAANIKINGSIFVYDKSLYTVTNDDQYDVIRVCLDAIREAANAGAGSGYSYVWPSGVGVTSASYTETILKINEKIGSPEYLKWDLTKFFEGSEAKSTTEVTYSYLNWGSGTDDPFYKVYSAKDNQYYTIGNINSIGYGNSIVFDTTVDEATNKYEDIYVYLKNNCTKTPPANAWSDATYSTANPSTYNAFYWNPDRTSNPFHVLTKGKGSVIFVLADGTNYVAGHQRFMGHIDTYQMISGLTLGIGSKDGGGSPAISSSVANSLRAKLDTALPAKYALNAFSEAIINKYSTTKSINDTTDYIHNNIFLVAISKNISMDFDAQQCMFAGFIYAPYMTFESPSCKGNGGMFGGMIVSDYAMINTANSYICTIPYDYYGIYDDGSPDYDPSKYMQYLMEDTGCTTTLGASSSRSWKVYGYN